jgi:hypothetical protein
MLIADADRVRLHRAAVILSLADAIETRCPRGRAIEIGPWSRPKRVDTTFGEHVDRITQPHCRIIVGARREHLLADLSSRRHKSITMSRMGRRYQSGVDHSNRVADERHARSCGRRLARATAVAMASSTTVVAAELISPRVR